MRPAEAPTTGCGLDDAILIKDNHIALAGGVGEAVHRAREARAGMEIEVECGSLDQVQRGGRRRRRSAPARQHGPGWIARSGRARASEGGQSPKLEASGGVTLENVAEVAATGVDFVSVGALTHSAPALDLSMTIER